MTNPKEKQREYNRLWREKNTDRARELARKGMSKWRLAHPIEAKLQKSIRRARIAKARIDKRRIKPADIHNWESRVCGICLEDIENMYHIDHIVPLSRGGSHEASNLQLAHPFCNQSKFTKLQNEIATGNIKS